MDNAAWFLNCWKSYKDNMADKPADRVYGPSNRTDILQLQSFLIGDWGATGVGNKALGVPLVEKDQWPEGWSTAPKDNT